ncbi:hypothetical protein LIER_40577 [Lithospermum erythrorhizon]|uniref:Uncharacterized protein n=1 Tax=Lithospermum erythrorhizon TaxID=34254 RepID=A0AAV3R0A9_LITER
MGVGWVVCDECKGVDELEHGKEGVGSGGRRRLSVVGRAEGELGWVCVGCPGEQWASWFSKEGWIGSAGDLDDVGDWFELEAKGKVASSKMT